MQNNFVKYLQEALSKQLPGVEAHQKMVPPGRRLKLTPDDEKTVRYSSVLFLLFPYNESIYTCLIKRPGSMKHHPGQIGFPGGKVEAEDGSPKLTAMREAEEEVGVKPGEYFIVGQLSDLFIEVSNFVIHPFLAWADSMPEFTKCSSEVEEIILFPIGEFMENEKIAKTELQTMTGKLKIPYYPYKNEIVWGATAMIMAELCEINSQHQLIQE